MTDSSQLQPNPFHAYRDPSTGRWVTVVCASDFAGQFIQKRPPTVVQLCISSDQAPCPPTPNASA